MATVNGVENITNLQQEIERLVKSNKKLQQQNQEQIREITGLTKQLDDFKQLGSIYAVDNNNIHVIGTQQQADAAGLNSPAQVEGKSNDEIWGADAAQLNANNAKVRASGEICIFEEQVNVNGVTQTYTSKKMPLYDNAGNQVGVICNSLEVTSYARENNYLKNLNLGKMQAFKIIEQEFRGTVNDIIATIDSNAQQSTNDISIKSHDQIDLQAIRQMLLNEQLKFSHVVNFFRLVTGEKKPSREDEDLQLFIASVTTKLKHELASHNLKVIVRSEQKLPAFINIETEYCRVILETLLRNAIRFNHDSDIIINIQLAENLLKLTVTGNNTSFTKHMDLFDLFTANVKNTDAENPGFMLSLCKSMLDFLGGNIDYQVTASGTDFWLTLPVKKAINEHATVAVIPEYKVTAKTNKKRKITVLVVEDSSIGRNALKKILVAYGFKVETAADGNKALKVMQKKSIDVVVTDIKMHPMGGIELLKNIRKEYQDKPVIAFTSMGSPGDRERYLEQGFDNFIAKPDAERQLIKLLNLYAQEQSDIDLNDAKSG